MVMAIVFEGGAEGDFAALRAEVFDPIFGPLGEKRACSTESAWFLESSHKSRYPSGRYWGSKDRNSSRK